MIQTTEYLSAESVSFSFSKQPYIQEPEFALLPTSNLFFLVYLCHMISNFVTELQGHSFQFNTMSSKTLFLFQVYVMDDDARKRFHMQRDPKDDRFKIMDWETCPAFCLALEAALHEAILENQERMNQAP